MNQNTAGAVLVLILATAGFVTGQPVTWMLAGFTAALAFLKFELDAMHDAFGFPVLWKLSTISALASWACAVAAAIALLV